MAVGLDLKEQLSREIGEAFVAIGADFQLGQVVRAARPEFGHFQCNGAMAAAKALGDSPRDIATRIASRLSDVDVLAKVEVAGPGFLNLTLSDGALSDHAVALFADPRTGARSTEEPMDVLLDFGGPNVAKPMHVGHLRSAIIGESLKRLFKFAGHRVIGDAHLGDWGYQMGLLIMSVQDEQPDLPYFKPDFTGAFPETSPVTLADLERLYPMAASAAKADDNLRDRARKATAELQNGNRGYRALWQHFVAVSKERLEADYGVLGVSFDLWNGESDVDELITPMIEDLAKKNLLEDDDGARVIFVHEKMVPKKDGSEGPDLPPLLVVSSEGSAMYGTTDLATIWDRKDNFDPDLVLYCVDQRQGDHFEQVFRASDKAGYIERSKLEHIGFGTMNGPDGKPFKTREGGVLKLADLFELVFSAARKKLDDAQVALSLPEQEREDIIKKVGLAALKFADLQNYRATSYVFDLDRFLSFEGKTGPYLLYAAVRILSILRKAEAEGKFAGDIALTQDSERNLLLVLDGFDGALETALTKRAPHVMAEHAYQLAGAFSAFYTQCPILGAEDEVVIESRLALAQLVLRQLTHALTLIGLEIPARM